MIFSIAKAEEVAKQAILNWSQDAWPVWPLDDDGCPIQTDIGCITHWQGIDKVEIISCSHMPEKDDCVGGDRLAVFEIGAEISRWESGNPLQEEDESSDDLETIEVWVAFDGEDYEVVQIDA